MKKKILALSACALMAVTALAQQTMWVYTGQVQWAFNTDQVGEATYTDATSLTVQGKTFAVSDIDSIVVRSNQVDDYCVNVTYSGTSATVVVAGNIAKNITASVSGANVVVTQDATVDKEFTYTLTGTTTNGSFTQNGSYKSTLVLNGVNITSTTGAAIDIENGKRIAVVLNSGTTNTLVDAANGSQKAALYFSGHPEFEGAGTLNVTGNTKHAISAKEYIQLKKTVGAINVLGSASDGIHCGKGKQGDENNYFQMNGGTVTIKNVKGDGIDTDDYGCFIIKGGSLDVTVDAEDVVGLKCDSIFTMSAGTINLNVTGKLSQGVRIAHTGNFGGGTVTATVSGAGSKGINAKTYSATTDTDKTTFDGGYLNFTGTDVTMTASGANVVEGTDTTRCMAIKADKDMTQSAGAINITLTGSDAKGIDVGGTFTRTGGTLDVTSSTKVPAVKADGNFIQNDGELTLICTGEEANALSSDGNVQILGGSVEIRCSGAGSKGIKVDGAMTVGAKNTTGPTMIVATTGTKKTGTTSGGGTGPGGRGGWGPGGGGSTTSSGGSPKAIKIMGIFYMYSGNLDVSTSSEGGEGIESKNTMYFDGGDVTAYCYDDCINCSGKIYIRGARVVCYSNGNDAIDSNANATGSLQITDGVCVAVSSKAGAEMGIDCDGNSRITISGGYIFSGGGNQGGGGSSGSAPGSASQGYYWMTGKTLSSSYYYSLVDASGNNIFTVKLPVSVSQNYSLISAPNMTKGSSYSLKYGTTAPTAYTSAFEGFYLGATCATTTNVVTFTAQ